VGRLGPQAEIEFGSEGLSEMRILTCYIGGNVKYYTVYMSGDYCTVVTLLKLQRYIQFTVLKRTVPTAKGYGYEYSTAQDAQY